MRAVAEGFAELLAAIPAVTREVMNAQRTLRRPVSCTGIGLHSGNKVTLSLKPAPADYGIRFQRSDLGGLEIPATVTHLGGIQYQTGLTREAVSVETVEHLLAALTALGIDNVIVELNTPEVPIMDGSAAPFVYLDLNEAGVKSLQAPRRYLKVLRPISLTQGDKRIALYPSDHFKVTYSISFDHPLLRHQSRTMRITEESFVEEIAPARTFGFLKEVEMLRQRGLALGGSLDNAIVLGETGVLNNALRFEDEFVRHKILDVIGDLSLVGHPVVGHLVAHRGGHALHTAFAARILEETDAWRLVDAPSESPSSACRCSRASQSRRRGLRELDQTALAIVALADGGPRSASRSIRKPIRSATPRSLPATSSSFRTRTLRTSRSLR